MIPVFYRRAQSSTAAVHFSPSAGKPKLVLADWLSHPEIAQHIQIESFDPASDEILWGAHDPLYITGVLSGKVANGFGNTSLAIANSLRYTVGSVVAAATHVLTSPHAQGLRVAVSPTSGFHHAGYDFGGGFCTMNGLMAAAVHVHALGLAKRILILDMDQHCGNGTDNIIKKLEINYVDHITATRSYRTAAQALACADLSANEGVRTGRYDLVIYQAGADIHVDDPLGGLLTTDQMIERDRLVFQGCAKYRVPLVFTLAGGYKRDNAGTIAPVLELHRNTMIECIKSVGFELLKVGESGFAIQELPSWRAETKESIDQQMQRMANTKAQLNAVLSKPKASSSRHYLESAERAWRASVKVYQMSHRKPGSHK